MRSPQSTILPVVLAEYDPDDQQRTRRIIEQAFDDLRGDVVDNRDQTLKPASLSMRRHQFLLMGA